MRIGSSSKLGLLGLPVVLLFLLSSSFLLTTAFIIPSTTRTAATKTIPPLLSSSRWKEEQKPPPFITSSSSSSSSRLSPSPLRYSKGGDNDSSSSSSNSTGGADLDYALGVQQQQEQDEVDDYFYADFGLRREPNGTTGIGYDDIGEQSILEARLQYAEGYVEMMQEQLDDLKTGQYYNTLSKQKQDLMDQLDSKNKALEELQESFHQLELQQQQQQEDSLEKESKNEQQQQRLLQDLITVVELQQIWFQQDRYEQESKKKTSKEQQEQLQQAMEESYEVQQKTLLQLEEQVKDHMMELNQTKSQLLELQQEQQEQQQQQQQQQQRKDSTAAEQQQNQQIIIGHEIINNTSRSRDNNDEIQQLKQQNRKLQREMEQALQSQKQLRLNEQADSRAKQYKFESIIKSKVYELERSLDEKVQEINNLKSQLDNYSKKELDWLEQQNELEATIAETAAQIKKEQQASKGYNVDLTNSQNLLKKFENEQVRKLAKLQNELKAYEKKEQSWITDKRDLETAIRQSRSDVQNEKLESQRYQSELKKLQYQVQQLEKKLELSSSQMMKKKETTSSASSSSTPPPQQKKKQQQDDVGLPSMMKMMTNVKNQQKSPPQPPKKPQQQHQSRPSSSSSSSQPQQPQKMKTPPEPKKPTTITTAEIRNWYLNTKNEVCGIVYNHPTLQDGAEITTSRIRQPKLANDYVVVETASGSQYKLGRKSSTAEAIQQQRQQVQKKSQPPSKQQQQQQQQHQAELPQMPSFSNMTNIFFPQSQQKTKKKDDDSAAGSSSSSSSAAVSKEQQQQKQQGSSSPSVSPLPKRKQPPRPSFQNIFTEGRLSSQKQHHQEEEEKKEPSTSSPAPAAAAAAAAAAKDVVVKNKRKQPPRPSFRNIFNEGRLSQQQQQQQNKLPEIRNWYLNEKDEVCGVVHGHQALEDGEVIVSSALSHPELARDFATVETASGSKYRLGRQERRPSIKNKMEEAEANATPQMQQPSTAASRSHATPSFANMTNIFFPQNKKQQANSTSGSTTTNPKKDPDVSTTKDKRKQAPRPSFPNLFEGSLSSSQKGGIHHHDPREASSLLDDETKEQKAAALDVDTAAASPSPTRKKKLPLTGKQLGNGKYLFAGPIRSSANGRCQIISAYHRQNIIDPDDEKTSSSSTVPDDDDKLVIVKISDNIDAMEREHNNFKKLWSGQQKGHIVQCHDYFKNNEIEESKSYLILERGEEDLKQRRHRLLGSSDDEDELRAALFAAVKCMDTFHSSRMVWTDLKSENFVLVKGDNDGIESFKAIDLESAVPLKGNPLDYTPEACPPEFAQAFVDGDPHSFVVDWNYDVWSFGMMAYELATRKGYYDNNNSHRIMKRLAGNDVPDLKFDISNNIDNPKLADMISQCLNEDPKKRPNAQKLLRHPYFKSNGSNFFGLSF